jgi:peptidoglycan/xylan/chitin deacetylase (PgdA/CDA1 family)/glycosyltransferase involved in cell wall biosynthesis
MNPLVSIVIPTRNRREVLLQTLRSLSIQHLPASPDDLQPERAGYEVIVVADGCTDGTVQAVRELASTEEWGVNTDGDSRRSRELIVLEQEWSGASAARNRGMRAARGEMLLLLDDDITAHPNLVSAHLSHHAHPTPRVVLGRIIPEEEEGTLHRQVYRSLSNHHERLSRGTLSFMDLRTANVSLPLSAALKIGGLDETIFYGEDSEFGYRLSRLGLRFVYAAEAEVVHRDPKTARALLNDVRRWGEGCVHIYRKWPELLPQLPLSAYGETSLRLRLARSILLRLSELPLAAHLITWSSEQWANSRFGDRFARPIFELVRSYYLWSGILVQMASRGEWARFTDPGVPVLMYHSVMPNSDKQEGRFTISKRRFRQQMWLLRLMGYRVRPVEWCVHRWRCGKMTPPRTVAITFDDGYRDNLTEAWPVLHHSHYPATLFVVTDYVGGTNGWERETGVGHKHLINWEEASKLDKEGLRIESHGATHRDLVTLEPAERETELRRARLTLEERLGRPVRLLAYPYGSENAEVRASAMEAGYTAAFTAHQGMNTLRTPLFGLKRVEIKGSDTMPIFALKVWAGEDPFRRLGRKIPRLSLKSVLAGVRRRA